MATQTLVWLVICGYLVSIIMCGSLYYLVVENWHSWFTKQRSYKLPIEATLLTIFALMVQILTMWLLGFFN